MPGGFAIKHLDLQALAQSAIAPLGPLVTVMDGLMAVIGAVTSLKDALASVPPDPTKLVEAIEKIAPVPSKLASLMPLVAFPQLMVTCIDIVIRALEETRGEIAGLREQMLALAAVEETAQRLKDNRLLGIFDCAKRNVQQEAVNLSKAMASIGSLIAIITTLGSLAQVPISIPDFTGFGEIDIDDALVPLDDFIEAFKALRKAVPL